MAVIEAPVDQGAEREPVLSDTGAVVAVAGRGRRDDPVVLARRTRGPRSEPKRSRSSRRMRGISRSSAFGSSALAEAVSKHVVEGVVGGQRGVDVARRERGREAPRSRRASRRVRGGQARHRQLGGQRVQAATTGNASAAARRSSGATRVKRCGAVSTSPSCSSRASASRTGVRLSPSHAHQLLVAQPLPGRERPVDDRVAQRRVRAVLQQVALQRRAVLRELASEISVCQILKVASHPLSFAPCAAIDMHVHLPTGDWVCGCVGHYADSIERYFGSRPRAGLDRGPGRAV